MRVAKMGNTSAKESGDLRICIIGAGTRFLSGITYHTLQLANEMAATYRVSVVPMRQLLPTFLFPGKSRVGAHLTKLKFAANVKCFSGVDWYWLPSMLFALLFLLRERPRVVVFQWWSATVLHSYAALALFTRMLGAKVIIEFHEVLDPAEAAMPVVSTYSRTVAPLVLRLAHAYIVHTTHDHRLLAKAYHLGSRPVVEIPVLPYDRYVSSAWDATNTQACATAATPTECNVLFFGLIRPYKGLEDLVRAFDMLNEEEVQHFHLTVVGETWENWTLPGELIAHSRYRDRITFVNRYVDDDEAAAYFSAANAVVLPYRRASSSGILQIAESLGLPVVVTRVEGLVEAVEEYAGAVQIAPNNIAELCAALRKVADMRGQRYANPRTWERVGAQYRGLFGDLLGQQGDSRAQPLVSRDGPQASSTQPEVSHASAFTSAMSRDGSSQR